MKCAMTGTQYTIYGYKGKQVRDNIHSADLIAAFREFFLQPRSGEVYNIGGGSFSNCSVLEAIALCEELTGRAGQAGATMIATGREITSGGLVTFRSSGGTILGGTCSTTLDGYSRRSGTSIWTDGQRSEMQEPAQLSSNLFRHQPRDRQGLSGELCWIAVGMTSWVFRSTRSIMTRLWRRSLRPLKGANASRFQPSRYMV